MSGPGASAPIPGVWICRRCGYRLTLRVISVARGTVGADARLVRETCPNGHGQLDQATEADRAAASAGP